MNDETLAEIEQWCKRGVPADNAPITAGECLSLCAELRVVRDERDRAVARLDAALALIELPFPNSAHLRWGRDGNPADAEILDAYSVEKARLRALASGGETTGTETTENEETT